MYLKRDQFVIPLPHTFCGNLVTTKAILVQQNSPKLPEYSRVQRNSEHFTIKLPALDLPEWNQDGILYFLVKDLS